MTNKLARALVLVLVWLGLSSNAWAFHEIESFSRTEMGGGNGSFFTGSPRFKGYDCGICHTNTPGKISIKLEVNRPDLLQGQYEANTGYAMTLSLVGEHRGLESAFNPNTFMLEIVDDEGQALGDYLIGPAPTELIDEGRIVAAEGFGEGENQWSLTWFSPREITGPATLYIAMVDGDGAGEEELRWIDPLNDDVATMSLRLCPVGETCSPPASRDETESAAGCSVGGKNSSTSLFLILLLAMALLRKHPVRALATLLGLSLACGAPSQPETASHKGAASSEPQLSIVDDGSKLMEELCASVRADSMAGVMKIETAVDIWEAPAGTIHRDCYLSANDRVAMLNTEEAKAEVGCDPPTNTERVACTISGELVLRRYLAQRNDLSVDLQGKIVFESTTSMIPGEESTSYWRSYYLGERQSPGSSVKAFTGAHIGRKLVVIEGGRVAYAVVIRSALSAQEVLPEPSP